MEKREGCSDYSIRFGFVFTVFRFSCLLYFLGNKFSFGFVFTVFRFSCLLYFLGNKFSFGFVFTVFRFSCLLYFLGNKFSFGFVFTVFRFSCLLYFLGNKFSLVFQTFLTGYHLRVKSDWCIARCFCIAYGKVLRLLLCFGAVTKA